MKTRYVVMANFDTPAERDAFVTRMAQAFPAKEFSVVGLTVGSVTRFPWYHPRRLCTLFLWNKWEFNTPDEMESMQ